MQQKANTPNEIQKMKPATDSGLWASHPVITTKTKEIMISAASGFGFILIAGQ